MTHAASMVPGRGRGCRRRNGNLGNGVAFLAGCGLGLGLFWQALSGHIPSAGEVAPPELRSVSIATMAIDVGDQPRLQEATAMTGRTILIAEAGGARFRSAPLRTE